MGIFPFSNLRVEIKGGGELWYPNCSSFVGLDPTHPAKSYVHLPLQFTNAYFVMLSLQWAIGYNSGGWPVATYFFWPWDGTNRYAAVFYTHDA